MSNAITRNRHAQKLHFVATETALCTIQHQLTSTQAFKHLAQQPYMLLKCLRVNTHVVDKRLHTLAIQLTQDLCADPVLKDLWTVLNTKRHCQALVCTIHGHHCTEFRSALSERKLQIPFHEVELCEIPSTFHSRCDRLSILHGILTWFCTPVEFAIITADAARVFTRLLCRYYRATINARV